MKSPTASSLLEIQHHGMPFGDTILTALLFQLQRQYCPCISELKCKYGPGSIGC
jgi:hypothetical protein